jgi:hypothetical protein
MIQFMMGRIFSGLQTNNEHPLPNDYETHFLHCIDYLRQAIMCAADVALEPHTPEDPDDLGPLDGSWGGHHGELSSHRSCPAGRVHADT